MKKYTLEVTEHELKMIRLGLLDRSIILEEEGLDGISEEYTELEYTLYKIQNRKEA